jgi:hypothetical protein
MEVNGQLHVLAALFPENDPVIYWLWGWVCSRIVLGPRLLIGHINEVFEPVFWIYFLFLHDLQGLHILAISSFWYVGLFSGDLPNDCNLFIYLFSVFLAIYSPDIDEIEKNVSWLIYSYSTTLFQLQMLYIVERLSRILMNGD